MLRRDADEADYRLMMDKIYIASYAFIVASFGLVARPMVR